MKNKVLFSAVIALLAIPLLFSGSAAAESQMPYGIQLPDANAIIDKLKNDIKDKLPDVDGLFDVPGSSDLKLRVIVHHESPAASNALPGTCSLSNPDCFSAVSSGGWKLAKGAWVYTLNPYSVPSSVGRSNLTTIAKNAFEQWSNATGFSNKILFNCNMSYTATNRPALDGKNLIAWGPGKSGALATTYTWYNQRTGAVKEVDTIMNSSYQWSWSNPQNPSKTCNANSFDAQDILTHELGHWMGLSDMYNTKVYQDATMYGYGAKGETKKDTLTSGDIAGVRSIYPN